MQGAPDTSIVDGSGIDLAKNVTAVQQYDQTHVNAVSRLCEARCAQAYSLWQACCVPASGGSQHTAQAGDVSCRYAVQLLQGCGHKRCAVAQPRGRFFSQLRLRLLHLPAPGS